MVQHLAEGVSDLLDRIGDDTVTLCESNSLRNAVQPDLFVMVKNGASGRLKASAARVAAHVDRTVVSDGTGFDPDPSEIQLADGRWALREHAAAIVLAGGSSTRMKQDKAMMRIDGRPMIEHVRGQLRNHFEQILISANNPEKYAFLGLPVIRDRSPGNGPMMGIASALEVSTLDLNLVVACDIPEINMNLAHRMIDLAKGYDIVVPRTEEGLLEPLFAVYRRSVLRRMHDLLSAGERRIRRLFSVCRTRFVEVPARNSLKNLNTMEEYLRYVGAHDTALR
jgi:molybdopterin-guanine dinucleotide biosynthesis protein A